MKFNQQTTAYKMNFFFTNNPLWIEQTGRIYALLERVKISEEQSKDVLHLRRTNRILTVGSTTAIEGNRLTTQQVFDVIEKSMYQYIDSATTTNISENDPVNTDFDPVNDPVNSFDVLELIKANPHINYDKEIKI